MLNRLIKYPPSDFSSDDRRRGMLLNIMLFGVATITLLSLLVVTILDVTNLQNDSSILYVIMICLFFALVGLYLLNQRGKVFLSSVIFLIIITLAISFADSPKELLVGRSLLFFIIPVTMASFLLRSYASFIVAGLLTVEHLYLWNVTDIQEDFSLFSTVSFFLFALITWLAARTLENALHETREINLRLDKLVDERTKELAEANTQLADANVRLTELDALKTKFVSDVTHELRTPISNISIYLEMAETSLSKMANLPDRVVGFLKVLRGETTRLTKLITDILNMSRLEQGISEIELQLVDANKIINEVCEANRLMAEAKGLEINFTPEKSPTKILADPDQLKQVITNFIANAINYTQEGKVQISTSINDENKFVFRIQDTGIGIEREDLDHLFERFYRGHQASLSSVPGSGLGLSITKEIVEAHNGTIDVQSEVGVGTVFYAYFPLDISENIQYVV